MEAKDPRQMAQDTRPVTELITDLFSQISDVTRKEVALARAEFSEAVTDVKAGLGQTVAGAILAIPGVTILLAAATIGLAEVVDPWLAALIVGAVTLLAAGALLMSGLQKMKPSNLEPKRTERSLKADATMVRESFQ